MLLDPLVEQRACMKTTSRNCLPQVGEPHDILGVQSLKQASLVDAMAHRRSTKQNLTESLRNGDMKRGALGA